MNQTDSVPRVASNASSTIAAIPSPVTEVRIRGAEEL
jgi:hypothetical protein